MLMGPHPDPHGTLSDPRGPQPTRWVPSPFDHSLMGPTHRRWQARKQLVAAMRSGSTLYVRLGPKVRRNVSSSRLSQARLPRQDFSAMASGP